MPAARDIPRLIVSVAKEYLLCSEADLKSEWNYGFPSELETLFGIKPFRSHDFFPESAYRGVFLPLLRYHPQEGLDFIIEVFNHSADWYAHPRVPSEHVAQPFEMLLTFADGMSRTQWCSDRLWMLYRGTSVGPNVLISILMALECWLLELAESAPHELDETLLSILRQCDSAALTAVAASVATAFPHEASETLLVLLQSRICIQFDRRRQFNETQAPSLLAEMFPSLNNRNKIYEDERKKADALPHRQHELEGAIMNLQLGSFAPRVHNIIDRFLAEMPPPENQSEDDRSWRLALHRMDLRHYSIDEDAPEAPITSGSPDSYEDNGTHIYLKPGEADADLQEMMRQDASQLQSFNARSELQNWGLTVFRHEEGTAHDPAQWRQKLQNARIVAHSGLHRMASLMDRIHRFFARDRIAVDVASNKDVGDWGRDGPGFVAAVCVRDHWGEMSDDERDWCLNIICSEIERTGNRWDGHLRLQRNSMSADRPCAWVMPILLGKSISERQRARVRQAFVIALTHVTDEVRLCAASGIGQYLWTNDRDLVLRSVNAIATEAIIVQREINVDSKLVYSDRRDFDEIRRQAAPKVRQRFYKLEGVVDDAHLEFDPTWGYGVNANRQILVILGQAPNEPTAIAAFARLAHTLLEWWNPTAENRQDRDYHLEAEVQGLLPEFLLQTPISAATQILQPILDSIDRHPREVPGLVFRLISVEDRQRNTLQFWSLWKQFAERVQGARWLAGLDEHSTGHEMISALFLETFWNDNVRHWPSLEGNAHHIHRLFESLPLSSKVLGAYVSFLYQVGEKSLPDAFIRIAQRLQQADSSQLELEGNTVFCLETLLLRYVYRQPLKLKRKPKLREAVIILLDFLIENGSSSAFRLRDDFVTPISTSP